MTIKEIKTIGDLNNYVERLLLAFYYDERELDESKSEICKLVLTIGEQPWGKDEN